MSILNEICMTIDIINNEARDYKGLKKKIILIRNRRRMESIINRYISNLYIDIDTLVDFMNIYYETYSNIHVDNLYIGRPDEYTTNLSYIMDNMNTFTFIYDNTTNNSRNKIKVLFKDNIKDKKSYIKVYEVNYNFKYIGIDEEYKKEIEYSESVIKLIIQKYLFTRMYAKEDK